MKAIELECSGCGLNDNTVNRNLFDGTCAACTIKSLYDYSYMEKCKKRNVELKNIEK
jgi:hypothetical protein